MHAFGPETDRQEMVVIYDPATGDVIHRHEAVSMKGAKHPGRDEIESDAWDELERAQPELARRLVGRGSALREQLALLHGDPDDIRPGRTYRVDVRTRTLIEDPRQRPGA